VLRPNENARKGCADEDAEANRKIKCNSMPEKERFCLGSSPHWSVRKEGSRRTGKGEKGGCAGKIEDAVSECWSNERPEDEAVRISLER